MSKVIKRVPPTYEQAVPRGHRVGTDWYLTMAAKWLRFSKPDNDGEFYLVRGRCISTNEMRPVARRLWAYCLWRQREALLLRELGEINRRYIHTSKPQGLDWHLNKHEITKRRALLRRNLSILTPRLQRAWEEISKSIYGAD